MNAEVNVVSERALHPLAINGESLQDLTHWLKSNGMRQISQPDPRRTISSATPLVYSVKRNWKRCGM